MSAERYVNKNKPQLMYSWIPKLRMFSWFKQCEAEHLFLLGTDHTVGLKYW